MDANSGRSVISNLQATPARNSGSGSHSVCQTKYVRGGNWAARALSVAGLWGLLFTWPTWIDAAQPRQPQVEAYAGQPLGVARLVVPLATPPSEEFLSGSGMLVHSDDGRPLYPVFALNGQLNLGNGLIGELLRRPPNSVTCFFLFTGNEPFRVTVYTPEPREFDVRPVKQPGGYRRTLQAWWLRYQANARDADRGDAYPAWGEIYFCGMLGQRLGLEPTFPPVRRPMTEKPPQQMLELLSASERLQLEMAASIWDKTADEPADRPVPAPLTWPWEPRTPAQPSGDSSPELMANYVPVDAFYLRFGRFNNYQWLNQFIQRQGGDISRLVSLRGQTALLDQRLQQQLGLEETVLARFLGETAIADIAIIGHDLYAQEGAALGILFHARNGPLLRSQLDQQRRSAWQRFPESDRRESTWQAEGVDVHYLGTVDHRYRSMFVTCDDFQLVTNCAALAGKFVAASKGQRRLADDPDFQTARARHPFHADQIAFAYFSRPFQAQLLSPQYQIELSRRMRATVELQAAYLAELAATQESRPHQTLDDLATEGFVPAAMARGGDGDAGPIQLVKSDGGWMDRVRGRRGSLLPIPDVTLTGVTRSESARYERLKAYGQQHWSSLDPLELAVDRRPLPQANHFELLIHARMAPFDQRKYGMMATLLGPPTTQRIETDPHEVISLQANLQGGRVISGVGPHQLFLGVLDLEPRGLPAGGPILRWLQLIRSTPGYLGAWPKPGLLDSLPLGFARTSQEPGMVRQPLGLYRWQTESGFAVLSYQPDVLERVVPQLQVADTDEPAQVRLKVGNLSASQFGRWVDALSFQRALQTTQGNARLMNHLTQQLSLPRSEGRRVAEELLNAQLVCPLGGDYRVISAEPDRAAEPATVEPNASTGGEGKVPPPAEAGQVAVVAAGGYWRPTAVDGDRGEAAQEFRSPLMGWFRGASAQVILEDERLDMHWSLILETDAQANPLSLPNWPSFSRREPSVPSDPAPPSETR